MRIFLTGATGFIGFKLAQELLEGGHQVLGLTRSEKGAHDLTKAGIEPHRGDLEDLNSLRSGAAVCDGVIHTGFDHNFSNYVANCHKDQKVIEALGTELVGSSRPLVVTSSTLMGENTPEGLADEDSLNLLHPNPRVICEVAISALVERGVNISTVRLSQIHDTYRQGLVTFLIEHAARAGRVAYIEDGTNRWSATHVSDAVRLFRLAIEKQNTGARYHATAEEGISLRAISETISRRLRLPVISISAEEASAHFGWLSGFVGKSMIAASDKTRMRLGWNSVGPSLLTDIEQLRL
ncbi:SDR family oxidoreductase [Pseudochrobactrum asaccharolyticum]|uniref:Nucleoside-diphosphate-sugar epimerase n=1 Tax=Pseudochrobactrum asaccharolyticum TaxID=354351 RepID=A0A366DLH4_9HYPH|nr:SDR family oxidoreductase [Pseudochrobactrum asaccharolyticum]RBO90932.1 nucleoside-diphosphate-sugar epimerase [Pseudochrobactrum asaccharolyticum]